MVVLYVYIDEWIGGKRQRLCKSFLGKTKPPDRNYRSITAAWERTILLPFLEAVLDVGLLKRVSSHVQKSSRLLPATKKKGSRQRIADERMNHELIFFRLELGHTFSPSKLS
jgi:hypothetical protein